MNDKKEKQRSLSIIKNLRITSVAFSLVAALYASYDIKNIPEILQKNGANLDILVNLSPLVVVPILLVGTSTVLVVEMSKEEARFEKKYHEKAKIRFRKK